MPDSSDPHRFVGAISRSGLSIYDPIEVGDPALWVPTPELEVVLDSGLRGLSLTGLPLRTRSKVLKEQVCKVLGYPVPPSFRRTHPRFPGQCFDTYIQKSNNLQVWNEELAPTRRYVLVRLSLDDRITKVKVVLGDALAEFDTTGKLTQKFQARCIPGNCHIELVAPDDTERLRPLVRARMRVSADVTPVSYPKAGHLLSIATISDRLARLVGTRFREVGHDQERNRGAALHRLVCKALGYASYQDDGRFPDVRHQLPEVKLQTSPTIDLGLVCPDSKEALDVPQIESRQIRHCDVRYAVFCGETDGSQLALTHLLVTTGEAFFRRFPKFGGKVLNKKLQIPLPADFFC